MFCREKLLPVQTMTTVDAMATFNVLNQEGRQICALLFPDAEEASHA